MKVWKQEKVDEWFARKPRLKILVLPFDNRFSENIESDYKVFYLFSYKRQSFQNQEHFEGPLLSYVVHGCDFVDLLPEPPGIWFISFILLLNSRKQTKNGLVEFDIFTSLYEKDL